MNPSLIAESVASQVIEVPIEAIDLTDWLFTLSDQEYQACSPAHIAAGTNRTETGQRLSLNVEQVGGNLLVQHYLEDVSEPHRCRVKSISDSFTGGARTTLDVTWEIEVTRLSADVCKFYNRVRVIPTNEFLEFLRRAGVTDFAPVIAGMAKNVEAHNRDETVLFGQDIERKARSGRWLPAGVGDAREPATPT